MKQEIEGWSFLLLVGINFDEVWWNLKFEVWSSKLEGWSLKVDEENEEEEDDDDDDGDDDDDDDGDDDDDDIPIHPWWQVIIIP